MVVKRAMLLTMLCRATVEDVYKIANLAATNTATVGASLSHVHVPGRELVPDELGDEIEIGMGIHNEEGFSRVKTDLPGLVSTMLNQLLDQSDSDRGYINVSAKDPIILLVNNLGGLSPLELGAITSEVVEQLDGTYTLRPVRLLSGTYMTSLNGLGFSITILKVADSSFVSLIDEPADAAGWSPPVRGVNWERGVVVGEDEVEDDSASADGGDATSNLTGQ